MKSNNMGSQVRRHTGERAERRYVDRCDEKTYHNSRDAYRLECQRSDSKKDHNKGSRAPEKKSQKEHRRDTKEYRPVKDKRSVEKNNIHDRRYRNVSPYARREGGHRNSPVELIVKGCRNTDSSSSSSSSDSESDHSVHRNHENRRKRRFPREEREDSYEELSRKKRQIESELSALLAEEAENDRIHNERKKSNRNQAFRERTEAIRPDRRVKQEHVSDDERGSRNARRNSPKRTGDKDWGKKSSADHKKPVKDKEKPDFGVSGKLAEDTNTYNGVVIKYSEPKEARKPKRRWRLYPFKGETSLDFIPIHRQSAYLFGRSRLIADIPIDHPSCSKQHAVLQYRLMDYKKDDGTPGRRLRPYIIDLDSSNGTYVNNKKIDPRRYVELLEKDIIKFGYSSREYVILHDQSKDETLDDDVVETENL